jgi:hypothetical protein
VQLISNKKDDAVVLFLFFSLDSFFQIKPSYLRMFVSIILPSFPKI